MGKLQQSDRNWPEFPIFVSGNFNGFDDDDDDGFPLLNTTRVEEKGVNCDTLTVGPPHLKLQSTIFDLTEDSFYRLLGVTPGGRCLLQEPIPTRASLSYAQRKERSGWDALQATYGYPNSTPIPAWHKEKTNIILPLHIWKGGVMSTTKAKPSILDADFDLPSDDDDDDDPLVQVTPPTDSSKEGVETEHATFVEVMHNSLKRKNRMGSLRIGESEVNGSLKKSNTSSKNMKASELAEAINTNANYMFGNISSLTSTAVKLEKDLEYEKNKTKNVARLQSDLEAKDMLIASLNIHVQQLAEELGGVKSDLEKVKSQKSASDHEVARLYDLEKKNSNKIKTLTAALSIKDSEKSELKKRINSLTEELTSEKSEHSNRINLLSKELTIAQKEVQNRVEQRSRDGAAIDAWKAKCALLTDQKKKLIEKIKSNN